MSESCNSRHFSWLMKSCFPNPQHTANSLSPSPLQSSTIIAAAAATTVSSLPDDLLLDILSRVPSSSLPPISCVCRRWSLLIHSSSFLSLRRLRQLLHTSVFSFSNSYSSLFFASLSEFDLHSQWKLSTCQLPLNVDVLSHARLCSIGPRIYILGRHDVCFYDTWSSKLSIASSMIYPRKKFAAAVFSGKIYVSGGSSRAASAVEEYNPDTNSWRVVSHAPRKRYGCVGAAVDGIFYIIGGLKIGSACDDEATRAAGTAASRAETYVYASSMDLYNVETRGWLRSRAVPGGGCVVAACAVARQVYILASHAVELSFWRFDARRQNASGFGEWCRIRSPPLVVQVRLDSTVRFSCVGVEDKVVLIQAGGCIDDLLRRSGRNERGLKEGLVMVYDTVSEQWSRGPDLPEVITRASCVSVEC